MEVIDKFAGKYDFLSNFYYCTIKFDGENYPSLEHAYQASKTIIQEERFRIKLAVTSAQAKKMGHQINVRPDWEEQKDRIMKELLIQKFNSSELRNKLLETNDSELIEGNEWGDIIWGCVQKDDKWVGENRLGKLLMAIRDEIIEKA